MRKIIIGLLFCLTLNMGSVLEVEAKAYDLNRALEKSLETTNSPDRRPVHLPKKSLWGDVTDVTSIMQKFANGLASLAAAIAILFIIYNCLQMVTAVGESDKIANAKKGLIWSLVGLVLIIGAYVLTKSIITLVYSGSVQP